MKLVFVRHGQPDYEKDELLPLGQWQAGRVATAVRPMRPTRLFASTMRRAQQTAEPTAAEMGLPVSCHDWLRELCWGDQRGEPYADGNPWDECARLLAEGAPLTDETWRQDARIANNRVADDIQWRIQELDTFLSSLGYIREGGEYRCKVENTETLAIFCHAGVLTVLLSHLLCMPLPRAFPQIIIDMASTTVVLFEGTGRVIPRLEKLSDTHYLQTEES